MENFTVNHNTKKTKEHSESFGLSRNRKNGNSHRKTPKKKIKARKGNQFVLGKVGGTIGYDRGGGGAGVLKTAGNGIPLCVFPPFQRVESFRGRYRIKGVKPTPKGRKVCGEGFLEVKFRMNRCVIST